MSLTVHAGQRVPTVYLGAAYTVQVPAFTRIEPYRSPDGQIEIDPLAVTVTGAAGW